MAESKESLRQRLLDASEDDSAKEEYESKLGSLKTNIEEGRAGLERREMAEKLAHGLTNIAAGMYGKSKDIGIGPLELKKSDLSNQYSALASDAALGERAAGRGMAEAEKRREAKLSALRQQLKDIDKQEADAKEQGRYETGQRQKGRAEGRSKAAGERAEESLIMQRQAAAARLAREKEAAKQKKLKMAGKEIDDLAQDDSDTNLNSIGDILLKLGADPAEIAEAQKLYNKPWYKDDDEEGAIAAYRNLFDEMRYGKAEQKEQPKKKLSAKDLSALKWAKARPKDPKAQKILESLKERYGDDII